MLHTRKTILRLETLEDRSMFAVAVLDHGTLNIIGTQRNDNIQISMQGSDIRVVDSGIAKTYNANRIVVLGLGGDDNIIVDPNVTIPVWLNGGKGNDTLQGGSGNDVILGGAGNDTIYGGFGQDKIFADNGNDFVDAGQGEDTVVGGKGDDSIHGGDDDDSLFGSAGNDQLYGELGQDLCDGGAGDDRVDGGDLNDRLYGGKGVDLLLGGDGDDFLYAGDGDDTCRGGIGNDRIKGGAGVDLLDGEAGNNLLDEDQDIGTTSNGLVVDLDSETSAAYRGKSPQQVLGVGYRLSNNNGTLEETFSVSEYLVFGGGSHDIVIDGVTIGQFDFPMGYPFVVFTTNPSGVTERPIPGNFPEIHPGSKVQIGELHLSKMQSIYDLSPQQPSVPKHFV